MIFDVLLAANPAEGTSATADSAEKPSVTITAIKPEAKEKTKTSFADDEESEDRDEAEATDEEINISDEVRTNCCAWENIRIILLYS